MSYSVHVVVVLDGTVGVIVGILAACSESLLVLCSLDPGIQDSISIQARSLACMLSCT